MKLGGDIVNTAAKPCVGDKAFWPEGPSGVQPGALAAQPRNRPRYRRAPCVGWRRDQGFCQVSGHHTSELPHGIMLPLNIS